MFQNVTEWRKRSNETRANDLVRCSYPSLRIPLIKVEKLILAFPRRGDKFLVAALRQRFKSWLYEEKNREYFWR